jgi:hypothetical protein
MWDNAQIVALLIEVGVIALVALITLLMRR